VGGTTSSYTYSPTPFGWGNGEQALKSPENFPGGALNYVSGPCTIFFPYKVGHLLRPVTHFKRTWSKFTHSHVTTHSIPRFRPHHGCSWAGDGASERCLTVAGSPETHEGAGARGPGGRGGPPRTGKFGCVEKRPTANWSVLGVSKSLGASKTGPRALGGPTGTRPRPCPPGRAFQDVWGPGRNPSSSKYIFGRDHGGVEGGTPPAPSPQFQDIYLALRLTPTVERRRGPLVAPDALPGRLPHGRHRGGAPGGGWAAPAPPTNWRALGVSKSLGVSKTAPGTLQARPRLRVRPARTGARPNWSVFGCVASPPPSTGESRRPRHTTPSPPPTPPPGPRPRRPSPHRQLAGAPGGPRRRPAGLAGRLPPPLRPPRLEGRPPRTETETAGTRGGDPSTLPPSGLPLGPWRHVWSPYFPRARCIWPAAAIGPPAGCRRPGGFSPHYILSDPIWVGKW
jgi:hypothetical protein